jgi:hypothetical protein
MDVRRNILFDIFYEVNGELFMHRNLRFTRAFGFILNDVRFMAIINDDSEMLKTVINPIAFGNVLNVQ